MNAPIKTEDAFHQLIHRNHMWGLWEIASQMTPQPRPEAVPYQWKWSVLEEVVRQSAAAVPVGDDQHADRRGAGAAAGRDRPSASPFAGGDPFHHLGKRRLHRGRGREGHHA